MPIAITLNDIGVDYGTTVTILGWRVDEGEAVEADDVLLEVETAKSTVEVGAPASGVLGRVDAPAGEEWDLREPVGFILRPGEEIAALPPRSDRPVPSGAASAAPAARRRAETIP